MTQTTEPVADKQPAAPAASSPKPKPATSPSAAPAASSPKPKPSAPSRSALNVSGAYPRLAPFDTYRRAESAKGNTPREESLSAKPVAKKRLIDIFPGKAANR